MFRPAIPSKDQIPQNPSKLKNLTTPIPKNRVKQQKSVEPKVSVKNNSIPGVIPQYQYIMPPEPKKDEKRQALAKLNADFKLGNYATDLVEFTLDICKKPKASENPRFPSDFYSSYVDELVRSAINIHRNICNANAVRHDQTRRGIRQENAIGEAVNLEHLILIAYHRGWISEKQHTRWQRMICDLHYGIIQWMSS